MIAIRSCQREMMKRQQRETVMQETWTPAARNDGQCVSRQPDVVRQHGRNRWRLCRKSVQVM